MHLSLSLMLGSRTGGAGKPAWVPDGAVAAYSALTDESYHLSTDFARSSTALWDANGAGDYQEYASNVLRRVDGVGLILEPARANKCTNANANPTDLTNITKSGDAAATLTVVDDAAALAAAGLDAICSSGMVFKLDNSAGAATAQARPGGECGNTNGHTVSAFIRGGAGNIQLSGGDGAVTFGASAGYVRRVSENIVPSPATDSLFIVANAGQVLWFILNQLEESAEVTTPIITSGAATTRAVDNLTLTPVPSAALDWHARYDDDSESVIASAVSGAYVIVPSSDIARPVVKMIWATAA